MKSKSMILLVVSLGFGLVAAVGISKVMGRSGGGGKPRLEMGPVLVASVSMDHGTELTEENIKVENWPLQIIPEDAVTSMDEIKNMAITTRLSKGLAILRSDIVPKSEIRRISIPPGFKVVAIKVSADDTINGLLAPGDKVDVIGVVQVRDEDDPRRMRTISKTFLKNITVFSVNDNMRAGGQREISGAKNNSIVGVLVNERQSEMIVLIQKVAQLKLVLRGDDFGPEEEGDITSEEEFRGVFGLGSQSEGETKTMKLDLAESHTMRIYSGGSYQTFKFRGNEPVDPPQDVNTSVSNSDDQDDFNHNPEIESGLEEDQYPDE